MSSRVSQENCQYWGDTLPKIPVHLPDSDFLKSNTDSSNLVSDAQDTDAMMTLPHSGELLESGELSDFDVLENSLLGTGSQLVLSRTTEDLPNARSNSKHQISGVTGSEDTGCVDMINNAANVTKKVKMAIRVPTDQEQDKDKHRIKIQKYKDYRKIILKGMQGWIARCPKELPGSFPQIWGWVTNHEICPLPLDEYIVGDYIELIEENA